jgi:hypothetical protein
VATCDGGHGFVDHRNDHPGVDGPFDPGPMAQFIGTLDP